MCAAGRCVVTGYVWRTWPEGKPLEWDQCSTSDPLAGMQYPGEKGMREIADFERRWDDWLVRSKSK